MLCTPQKTRWKSLLALTISTTVLMASPASAVDTVETWDLGATDVDFYTGYEGLGLTKDERRLSSDIMLGYGIIDRLSAYLGAAISGTEQLSAGAGEVYLGVFGTPVDTDHFDLDLFMDFRLGGDSFSEFQLAPSLELNFDIAPDLEIWGVYFVLSTPIFRQILVDENDLETEEVATSIETIVGTYFTIAERHQLLLDFEMAFHPMATNSDPRVEIGSVGIGYNVTVHDAIELITEVRFDIPQEGDTFTVGFLAGLIATLPSVRTPAWTTVGEECSESMVVKGH